MLNVCMRVWNRDLAVLAEPALALLTGYKLIADLGNQNKTCDNKPLWLFSLQNAIGNISHVIETQIIVYQIGI